MSAPSETTQVTNVYYDFEIRTFESSVGMVEIEQINYVTIAWSLQIIDLSTVIYSERWFIEIALRVTQTKFSKDFH